MWGGNALEATLTAYWFFLFAFVLNSQNQLTPYFDLATHLRDPP